MLEIVLVGGLMMYIGMAGCAEDESEGFKTIRVTSQTLASQHS